MNTSFVFFFIFFLLRFVSSAPEAISSDLSLDKTRVSDASAPEPVAIPDLVLHEQATHLKARHCPPQPRPSGLPCTCSNQTLCGLAIFPLGICVDLSNNDDHCGRCFHNCGPTQTCQGGQCRCIDSGFTACGQACVNLQNNERNCGECFNWCSLGQTCRFGACRRF